MLSKSKGVLKFYVACFVSFADIVFPRPADGDDHNLAHVSWNWQAKFNPSEAFDVIADKLGILKIYNPHRPKGWVVWNVNQAKFDSTIKKMCKKLLPKVSRPLLQPTTLHTPQPSTCTPHLGVTHTSAYPVSQMKIKIIRKKQNVKLASSTIKKLADEAESEADTTGSEGSEVSGSDNDASETGSFSDDVSASGSTSATDSDDDFARPANDKKSAASCSSDPVRLRRCASCPLLASPALPRVPPRAARPRRGARPPLRLSSLRR